MAIPFKSPIKVGSICASDGNATKLTLNVYDMKLQSSDSSIQINGASGNNFINLTSSNININTTNSGNLRITSSNINITDNDQIVLQHYNNANIFGNHTTPTYLEGYPFYISGLGTENDVLIFNENGITLSNNTKNTNIKGSNINITDNDQIVLQHYNNANIFGNHTTPTYLEGYPFYISGLGTENDVLIFNENGITLSNNTKNTNIKGSNIVIDGSRLTVPADTRLNSITRTLEPTSIACINDLGFEITPYENTI